MADPQPSVLRTVTRPARLNVRESLRLAHQLWHPKTGPVEATRKTTATSPVWSSSAVACMVPYGNKEVALVQKEGVEDSVDHVTTTGYIFGQGWGEKERKRSRTKWRELVRWVGGDGGDGSSSRPGHRIRSRRQREIYIIYKKKIWEMTKMR